LNCRFEGNPGLCGPQVKVACKFAQPISAPTPAHGPSSGLSPITSPGKNSVPSCEIHCEDSQKKWIHDVAHPVQTFEN